MKKGGTGGSVIALFLLGANNSPQKSELKT